jgi:hypothetical protein
MNNFSIWLIASVIIISGCRKKLNDDTTELKKGGVSKLNLVWKIEYEKNFPTSPVDANYYSLDFINLNSKNLYCEGNNLYLNTLDGLVCFDANTGAQLNVVSYCNQFDKSISIYSSIGKTICDNKSYFYNLKTKQSFFELQNTGYTSGIFPGYQKVYYQGYKNNQLCIIRAKNSNAIDTIIKINYVANSIKILVLREEILSNSDSILILMTKSTDLTGIAKLDLICYNLRDNSIYLKIQNLNTETVIYNDDHISNAVENDNFYFQIRSRLVCIDLINKSKQWEYSENGIELNNKVPIEFSNEVVTVTSEMGNRIGFNKKTGAKLWFYPTGFISGKIVSNKSSFFYTYKGGIIGINSSNGQFNLQATIGSSNYSYPRYLETNQSGDRLFYYDSKYLYCFDISDF